MKKLFYQNKRIFFLTILVFFLGVDILLIEMGIYKNKSIAPLEVSYLNIGQGDAILIDLQKHFQVLIDGGPSGKKVLAELSRAMPVFDNKIEIIISTHPDRDHFVGLIDVVKKYNVGKVLINGQKSDDELWKEFQKRVRQKNIEIETVGEGSVLNIGPDFKMSFFNPDTKELFPNKKAKKARNDSSVVARLDYGQNSFLFTGDAGFDSEADMIFDGEDLDVDYLKVGHHGSRYSSSKFFLARVSPKWSIISVGENDYGHPTEETMDRLKKAGSKIFRTDQLGTIVVRCFDKHNGCAIK